MKTIVFRNDGLIDPRSITTFGVSSKEKDSAIGYFGTGLKYAIAILLREGCDIVIQSGDSVMNFSTKKERIRVDDFELVTMNNEPLGFTTELGKNWQLWQAFRELYCNCMDENGSVYESTGNENIGSNETVIMVSGMPFFDVWSTRSEIILSTEPFIRTESVNIHRGRSQYIFYRGIRVADLGQESLYTYDIQSKLDLTEDRTVSNAFWLHYYIKKAIAGLSDKELIREVVTADKSYFEHNLEFSGEPSAEFMEVCRSLALSFDTRLNKHARDLCKNWLLEALTDDKPYQMNHIEVMAMEKAVKFCKSIGFNVDDKEIVVSEYLGDGVMGRAHNDKIYISKRTLLLGCKQIAGTLIEEYLHLTQGLVDETYQMQNYLFDTIISLGEMVVGEPL